MSCCMGFISAILEKGFNVWCSYRCSRRSVVFLEIYSHFCKQKALDPWFVMKAAFGPGCGGMASPPLLLAFRECLETSPDQWWAGASEWGTSPSLEGLSSTAVTGTAHWQGAVTFTQQVWADEQMETTCPHFRLSTLAAASHYLSGLGGLALWCSNSVSLDPPTLKVCWYSSLKK